ncbi:unnamed protein product, partial [Didymodactylos carnosus]
AYGISQIHGNKYLAVWKWIFIIEGIPTICLGILTVIFLVDAPAETVKWLSTNEQDILINHLKKDENVTGGTEFLWKQIYCAFIDWKVHLYMLIDFSVCTPLYSLSFFLPTLLEACMGTCTILPLILSWATANIGGQRKRAVASALIIVLIMVLLLKFLLKREKKRRELLDGRRLAAEDTEYASTDKHRSFSYIL